MSTMRALAVQAWGEDPKLTNLPTPPKPTDDSTIQVKVIAAGLPQLVRSQASGKHYSVKNTKPPFIPGSDGIGVIASGAFVYFSTMATGGGFAEFVNVPKHDVYPVPFPDGLSYEEKVKQSIKIAAIFNPAMSSWLAFKTRTFNLRENFTVVINGATSVSGKIAISHARALGAGKVIGLARNETALKQLPLDQYIVVQDPAEKTDFAGQLAGQRIDVIFDYIYGGGSTLQLFHALPADATRPEDFEVQYVQIGSLGGVEMDLPSMLLRSKNLIIRGSGPGAWNVVKDFEKHFPGLLQRLVEGVGEFDIVERRLEDVEAAWADRKARSVFVI